MKNFKKLFSIVLTLAMVLSLAACGSSESTETSADSSENAEEADTGSEEKEDTEAVDAAEDIVFKIGICNYVDDPSLNQIIDNIESQLKDLGEEAGVTFETDVDNANGDSTVMQQIIDNFIANDVDLMVGVATPVAMLMQASTEDNELPVVFAAVSDPVGAELVDSMDAPGANLTGTSDYLNTDALLDLIFALDPDAKKIGLLYDLGQDSSTASIAAAKEYLDGCGVEYVEKTGTTVDEVTQAAQALVSEGVDAVFTPTDNTIQVAEPAIYEIFSDAGIPHYCGADSFALVGAFVGYGVDYANLGKETAEMIKGILVDGDDPAATPVKTFDNGIVTVNTETCEALGYDFDEVSELFDDYATSLETVVTSDSFDDLEE